MHVEKMSLRWIFKPFEHKYSLQPAEVVEFDPLLDMELRNNVVVTVDIWKKNSVTENKLKI